MLEVAKCGIKLRINRAEYDNQIVVTLSRQLVLEYGNSFEEKNLLRMIQFSKVFTEKQIVSTV
ncbi:MAG TPA: DUF1016 N-terminal domain-containing protein [Ignavibacteria bacterium]